MCALLSAGVVVICALLSAGVVVICALLSVGVVVSQSQRLSKREMAGTPQTLELPAKVFEMLCGRCYSIRSAMASGGMVRPSAFAV
jgi:hypothetical protein